MAHTDTDLTDTAAEAAGEAGLGDWLRTTRVNSRRESALLIPGLAIALICLIGGYFLVTSGDIPVAGRIVFALMAVVFTAVGGAMALMGWQFHRSGKLLLHQFRQGFVLERTRGDRLAVQNHTVTADLFEYVEPGDSTSSSVDHVMLRLTLPDGATIAMSEPQYASPDALLELGERCGAGEPVPLEHRQAIELLTRESW